VVLASPVWEEQCWPGSLKGVRPLENVLGHMFKYAQNQHIITNFSSRMSNYSTEISFGGSGGPSFRTVPGTSQQVLYHGTPACCGTAFSAAGGTNTLGRQPLFVRKVSDFSLDIAAMFKGRFHQQRSTRRFSERRLFKTDNSRFTNKSELLPNSS